MKCNCDALAWKGKNKGRVGRGGGEGGEGGGGERECGYHTTQESISFYD